VNKNIHRDYVAYSRPKYFQFSSRRHDNIAQAKVRKTDVSPNISITFAPNYAEINYR